MKVRKTAADQQMEVAIPFDIVSTRIDELQSLLPEIESAFEGGSAWRCLVMDLQGCEMVDSAGLNFLISLHKLLEPKQCRILLKHCDKNLIRTFRFSRLDRYVDLSE